jgi:hypothetical protein
MIRNAKKWLKERFKRDFIVSETGLSTGVQEDYISCIPAAMNAIAHGIFGDGIWDPKRRYVDRIDWFTRLVEEPAAEVT